MLPITEEAALEIFRHDAAEQDTGAGQDGLCWCMICQSNKDDGDLAGQSLLSPKFLLYAFKRELNNIHITSSFFIPIPSDSIENGSGPARL
jgi:hypothetical protein